MISFNMLHSLHLTHMRFTNSPFRQNLTGHIEMFITSFKIRNSLYYSKYKNISVLTFMNITVRHISKRR